MTNETSTPVVVSGAAGKMGREVIKAVTNASDMTLCGAIDHQQQYIGQDSGEVAGCGRLEIPILNDLQKVLAMASQEKQLAVMVDFTHPGNVYENARSAIAYGVRFVAGTTGLSSEQIQDLAEFSEKASTGALITPNFSIGVILLQQAAIAASQYFDNVEIIELHHNQEADAPSDTAIKTVEMLSESGKTYNVSTVEETEKMAGARGCIAGEGINIHSVRLPGLIDRQEVIFGGLGQIYTIRHDASDRSCYMPGVLLAIRKVQSLTKLTYGLEKIL